MTEKIKVRRIEIEEESLEEPSKPPKKPKKPNITMHGHHLKPNHDIKENTNDTNDLRVDAELSRDREGREEREEGDRGNTKVSGGEGEGSNKEELSEDSREPQGHDGADGYTEDTEDVMEEAEADDDDIDNPGKGEGGGGEIDNEEADINLVNKALISRLKRVFYETVNKIADVEIKGYKDEQRVIQTRWDFEKLMLRRFRGHPLNKCKTAYQREAVILILDTSGSMMWWAELLTALSELARARKDVETYIAPNGIISRRLEDVADEEDYYDEEYGFHKKVMKMLRNRSIIYVGDYDGANTPIELSWRNTVYWICPETRYRMFWEHDWVDYSESQYKGVFFRVASKIDLLKALQYMQKPFVSGRFYEIADIDWSENETDWDEDPDLSEFD